VERSIEDNEETKAARRHAALGRNQEQRENEMMTERRELRNTERDSAPDALDLYLGGIGQRPLLTWEEEVEHARHIEEGEHMILAALAGSPAALRELATIGAELREGKLRMRDLLRDADGDELADAAAAERLTAALEGADALARSIEQGRPGERKRKALLAELTAARIHRRILDRVVAAVREGTKGRDPKRRATLAALERGRRMADDAKAALIEANLGLVVMFAKRHRNQGLPLSDLIQEGNLGLMRAADKFDHRRDVRFATYASWWIRQQLTRAVADQGKTIRVPIHMVESRRKVARMRRLYVGLHGREPDEGDLARSTGLAPEKLRAVAQITPEPASLDAPVGGEGDATLMEFVADQGTTAADEQIASTRMQASARGLLHELTPREQEILRMRFGLDGREERTLQEIGSMMSLSRERVRQIESEALRKLRRTSERGELGSYLAA
jgi:RNA polymerase primary sigma factor